MPGVFYRCLTGKPIVFLLVGAAFVLAASARIIPPYHRVFTAEGIRFSGVDAYYHVRLVENLLRHYPYRINYDPYLCFPAGDTGMSHHFWPPFFDWVLGSVCLLFGLGHPAQRMIETVAAFFPAILGALTVLPAYFLGKYIFNRWCGILAAFLLAVLPGEFLGRSILGFADHHAAEVLFSTVAMVFVFKVIRAISSPLSDFCRTGGRSLIIAKNCFLSGIFLGIYLATWTGALIFVFILSAAFVIQSFFECLQGRRSTALPASGAAILLLAGGLGLALLPSGYLGSANRYFFPLTLLVGASAPAGAALAAKITRRAGFCQRVLFCAVLVIVPAVMALAPDYLRSLAAELQSVRALDGNILETWPLLYPAGKFSPALVWNNFGVSFILALTALILLVRRGARQSAPEKTLLIIWSVVMFALTLYMRRFAYYLAVNVSLLTAWLVCRVISAYCFRRAPLRNIPEEVSTRRGNDVICGYCNVRSGRLRLLVCLIVASAVIYAPCLPLSLNTARRSFFGPDNAWTAAVNWMKDNTPDPFCDPEYYYRLYSQPADGEAFAYPGSAYGVMALCDYGHWILRGAHRIPLCTPFRWDASAGNFFTASDESFAGGMLDVLRARYVVVDHAAAIARFSAALSLAGKRELDFKEVYYVFSRGEYRPVLLFYPAYYRSMAVRLFCFDGKAVETRGCRVYSFKEDVSSAGSPRKVILDSKVFVSEDAARAYMRSQKHGRHVIAGDNPFVSPVRMAALHRCRLVFCFPNPQSHMPPEIKIFEYCRP